MIYISPAIRLSDHEVDFEAIRSGGHVHSHASVRSGPRVGARAGTGPAVLAHGRRDLTLDGAVLAQAAEEACEGRIDAAGRPSVRRDRLHPRGQANR